MNSASRIASTNALQSVNAKGLNHAQSNGVGSGADPAKNCQSAATTKIASARYWMPSRTFWIRSPISTPRQLTQVIAAMNTTPLPARARQRQILEARQAVLDPLADLDSAPADPGHRRDEHHARRRHQGNVLGERPVAEEGPEVDARDLGEIGQDDHARHGDP